MPAGVPKIEHIDPPLELRRAAIDALWDWRVTHIILPSDHSLAQEFNLHLRR